MSLKSLIQNRNIIFTEGAVLERSKREFEVELDPDILHASLIYSLDGQKVLTKLYNEYLTLGLEAGFPMITLTPTWRANIERLQASEFNKLNVNGDCFRFLDGIRSKFGDYKSNIYIGGLIGCKGDAYKPEEALEIEEAYHFHAYQIKALADAGVDFLIAETLPALPEAIGISKAMAETGKDYVISFVIRPEGTLLDGTVLHDAISEIDSLVSPKPLFYMVNCVHSSVLISALECNFNKTELIKQRLAGIQANTSNLSPEELDENTELQSEDPEIFAESMRSLSLNYGIRIIGGCCGTDSSHIKCMIDKFA